MILHDILAYKRQELAESKARTPMAEMIALAERAARPLSMAAALTGSRLKLIAEVKKASPSRGLICPDLNPVGVAMAYADHHAAAISVLTEACYFLGSLNHLQEIRGVLDIARPPLLRKDFIFDPYQVYESLVWGADSLLLIAAIVTPPELEELVSISHSLGMEPLVEVHDEAEIDIALTCRAWIVGINNRDLGTFETDLAVTERLRPMIPPGRVIVSESGIKTAADVRRMRDLGIDAVLVGEALTSAPDIGARIKELFS
jgi:indole-3-glycerol phosphate synthase